MNEIEAREIAIMMAAAVEHLHLKDIFISTLNPWMVRLDQSTVLYIDLIWCICTHITALNIEKIDPKISSYIGTIILK